jgi:hypothetical protein
VVPEEGVEPSRRNNPSTDFKSGVSAISPLWPNGEHSLPKLAPSGKVFVRALFDKMRLFRGPRKFHQGEGRFMTSMLMPSL